MKDLSISNKSSLTSTFSSNDNIMDHLWIFGYGSLLWRPEFKYEQVLKGHIKGYVRRFYQGNIVHRGSTEQPGRVATLIEERKGETYGCAYKITRENAGDILKYLEDREITKGGYKASVTLFYPENNSNFSNPIITIVYIAQAGNEWWMGEKESDKIAAEISRAKGSCGSNFEYFIKIWLYMKREFPLICDSHLENIYTHLQLVSNS